MHTTRLQQLLATALLALVTSASAAQDKGLQRLIAGGIDGNVRAYVARCLDGTHGTVRVSGDSDQICAIAQGGEPRCSANWSLMQAGRDACGAPATR